jgi:hypothetical protein
VSILSRTGLPAFGPEGWSEKRWTRDPQGRVTSVLTVDTLGNQVADPSGVAERRTTRAGPVTKTRRLGVGGQPVRGADGVAGRDTLRDAYGRVISETAIDVSDLPGRDPKTGCATLETRRDAGGDPIAYRCLDPRGVLVTGHEGWATRRLSRNAQGHVTTVSLEDATGAPVAGREGWATEVRTHDPRGALATRRFLGTDGGPVGHAMAYDRDRAGRVVRERYVDTEGAIKMGPDGWATRHLDHDALGRLVSEGYGGVQGKSTRKQTVRTRYGVGGRVVETRYLAPSGVLALGPKGWAIERRTHDDRGRLVGIRFFDATEAPGLRGHPHVGERHVRDAVGRLIERQAMAAKGVIISGFGEGRERWAIERQRFDAHGRRTSRAMFDAEDRPVVGDDGLHAIRWEWNERGQLAVQERLLAPNRPAPEGWARQHHRYDRYGRLGTISYQDMMGQPATVWNGVGIVELTYGRGGRLGTMSWHRPDGKPMDAKVCFPGSYCGKRPVHEARYRYDGPGEAVEMTLHDLRGTQRKRLDCAKGQCF